MTDEVRRQLPERAERAFESNEAFERDGAWFEVTTTRFEGRVTATETDGWPLEYTLEVRAPTLSEATEEAVGPAVEEGWFETYALRLEDAPMAVREDVHLDDHRVFEEAGDAVAVFVFRYGNADRAPAIAKAMTEYTEGTYVEGIVPGYEYGPPVSDLLSRATQAPDASGGDHENEEDGEDGEDDRREDGAGRGPMPM